MLPPGIDISVNTSPANRSFPRRRNPPDVSVLQNPRHSARTTPPTLSPILAPSSSEVQSKPQLS
jgi:hypothetical protein